MKYGTVPKTDCLAGGCRLLESTNRGYQGIAANVRATLDLIHKIRGGK
ncbi:hypothetical protein SBA6_480027 [Candidatus Sulfopaludibacter sp. SbA6]|nr:hypothetical protein SBA6_480027 [Candidatus Sulfopaludibacter sp. SbA6]